MKYNININQVKCIEYGLNLQQGAILDLIGYCSVWAEGKEFEDGLYYYLSAGKIVEEYPLITDKKNTILGIIKTVLEKGLIKREIYNNKSYYKLTLKGVDFFKGVEKNQEGCGKKSIPCVEKNQDNNITNYNITNNNNTNNIYFENQKLNDSFLEFIKHRKEIKKKLTETSLKHNINKINKLLETYSLENVIGFIENSILNGYQGIFEDKKLLKGKKAVFDENIILEYKQNKTIKSLIKIFTECLFLQNIDNKFIIEVYDYCISKGKEYLVNDKGEFIPKELEKKLDSFYTYYKGKTIKDIKSSILNFLT